MTNIHYKVVELWPDDHLIVARYWTDVFSEEDLASDGNRNADGTPVRCRTDVAINLSVPPQKGEELEKLIIANAPLTWLQMLEAVKDPKTDTDISHIEKLVGKTKTKSEEDIKILLNLSGTASQEIDIDKLLSSLKK